MCYNLSLAFVSPMSEGTPAGGDQERMEIGADGGEKEREEKDKKERRCDVCMLGVCPGSGVSLDQINRPV